MTIQAEIDQSPASNGQSGNNKQQDFFPNGIQTVKGIEAVPGHGLGMDVHFAQGGTTYLRDATQGKGYIIPGKSNLDQSHVAVVMNKAIEKDATELYHAEEEIKRFFDSQKKAEPTYHPVGFRGGILISESSSTNPVRAEVFPRSDLNVEEKMRLRAEKEEQRARFAAERKRTEAASRDSSNMAVIKADDRKAGGGGAVVAEVIDDDTRLANLRAFLASVAEKSRSQTPARSAIVIDSSTNDKITIDNSQLGLINIHQKDSNKGGMVNQTILAAIDRVGNTLVGMMATTNHDQRAANAAAEVTRQTAMALYTQAIIQKNTVDAVMASIPKVVAAGRATIDTEKTEVKNKKGLFTSDSSRTKKTLELEGNLPGSEIKAIIPAFRTKVATARVNSAVAFAVSTAEDQEHGGALYGSRDGKIAMGEIFGPGAGGAISVSDEISGAGVESDSGGIIYTAGEIKLEW